MGFKVMGVTAGINDNSCEILMNEALSVCQDQGAEVSVIDLKDREISFSNGPDRRITDLLLDQDAVIFSAPFYALIPHSMFLKFIQYIFLRENELLNRLGSVVSGERFGAIISVGWSGCCQSVSLDQIQCSSFSDRFRMVDIYNATLDPAHSQLLLYEAKLARARMIGQHIMDSLRSSRSAGRIPA